MDTLNLISQYPVKDLLAAARHHGVDNPDFNLKVGAALSFADENHPLAKLLDNLEIITSRELKSKKLTSADRKVLELFEISVFFSRQYAKGEFGGRSFTRPVTYSLPDPFLGKIKPLIDDYDLSCKDPLTSFEVLALKYLVTQLWKNDN